MISVGTKDEMEENWIFESTSDVTRYVYRWRSSSRQMISTKLRVNRNEGEKEQNNTLSKPFCPPSLHIRISKDIGKVDSVTIR